MRDWQAVAAMFPRVWFPRGAPVLGVLKGRSVFAADAPIETVKSLFAQIEERIAPADPLLIYLRPIDLGGAVARVHAERGEPWSSRNVAAVTNFAWARARGLSGQRAVIEFYRAWEHVVDELLAASACAHVLLPDPQLDWHTALQRIVRSVR